MEKQGVSDVVQQVGAPLVLSQRRDCGERPRVCGGDDQDREVRAVISICKSFANLVPSFNRILEF